MSIALATTWEDRLQDLGNIPASRVRTNPAPGTATVDDVSRKRREYFHAGVELLWMVDHRTRTVTVFRSAQDATVYYGDDIIDDGNVLPGWQVNIGELFSFKDRS